MESWGEKLGQLKQSSSCYCCLDDDDYNPDEQVNSRIADAVATFGLSEKAKLPPEPEAPKPATKKVSATSLAAKANARSHNTRNELSKAEILEMQQRGELEVFADLLGMFFYSISSILVTCRIFRR